MVQKRSLRQKFERLAETWRAETIHLSSSSELAIHPAYQQIIGMGPDAIPFILEELQRKPGHWSWALRAISREDPVKEEHHGDLDLIAQDWIEWGKENANLPKYVTRESENPRDVAHARVAMDQPFLPWLDRSAVDARIASIDQAQLGYDDCEARYLLGNRPFTGFSAIRYTDGSLSSLCKFENGIEHGLSVGWYPDGQIKTYAETAESVYHGLVVKWDANGVVLQTLRYDLGLEVLKPDATQQ